MTGLPKCPVFDIHCDKSSVGTRWNKYITKLENLFTGLNIDKNKRKKSLLLHYVDDEVFDTYETLGLGASDDNYDATKK